MPAEHFAAQQRHVELDGAIEVAEQPPIGAGVAVLRADGGGCGLGLVLLVVADALLDALPGGRFVDVEQLELVDGRRRAALRPKTT
ncbi:MAG: hypothetical protein R3F59_15430 [Myxococcota bacterium]